MCFMKDLVPPWLDTPLTSKLLVAAIAVSIALVVVQIIQRAALRHITDSDVRYRARKILRGIAYVISIGILMNVFSDRLSTLTVAFGVAGAGIAFALQEVIASVAGWVALTLGNFYAPGDRIQLGGIKGDVIDIGVLRTTMMEMGQWVDGDLYNGRIVRIANSFVFKEPVFNYSADFPFLWDEVKFPIRYGSDWKLTEDVLKKISDEILADFARQSRDAWKGVVRKYLVEDAQVDPMITLRLTDNWMEFTLRYVVSYERRRGTKDQIHKRFLEASDASNGRIKLASMTVELVAGSFMDVRVSDQHPSQRPI
jgi:small-conductance mechanosensitive channel